MEGMDLNEAARIMASAGGKKRWEGRTKAEREAHARAMGIKSGEAKRRKKQAA